MWSNARPPSRPSVGDHFNNNSNNNPYSRSSADQRNKTGSGSADPWDWGWGGDENNANQQQDDWITGGWGQSSNQSIMPVQSHVNKQKPSMYPPPPRSDPHRTPDLIPERPKSNHGMAYQVGNQRVNSIVSQQHPSDFFENIDLVSNNQKSSPSPKLYNPSDIGRSQPGTDSVFPYFQPQNMSSPHNVVQNNGQNSSYFRQTSSPRVPSTEPFYQQQFQHQPSPPSPMIRQQKHLPAQQQPHPPPPLLQQNNNQPSFSNYPTPPPPFQQFSSAVPPIQPLQQYNNLPSFQSQSTPVHFQSASLKPSPQPSQQQPPPSPVYQNLQPFQYESTQSYQHSYNDQNTFNSKATPHNTNEVENIEVPSIPQMPPLVQESEVMELKNDHSLSPDNQETVSDNEEHVEALPLRMANLRLDVNESSDFGNNTPGWENQEVAPRCELDRNQYLETGQFLESGETVETVQRSEVDPNDEGEPLPPPGLDRMVTGQVTDLSTQRSVLGQTSNESINDLSTMQRHVLGQQNHSESPVPSDLGTLQRLVPGQTNHEDSPPLDTNMFQRMVPGQNLQSQRMIPGYQMDPNDMGFQRLIPGQTERPPLDTRMIPGQISDEDAVRNQDGLERMVPGGISEQNSLTEDGLEDERMVPGGLSDVDSQMPLVMNDDVRYGSERMIPGRTSQADSSRSQNDSSVSERRISAETERLATIGSIETQDSPPPQSVTDGVGRHVLGQRGDTGGQSRPDLHRRDPNGVKTPDRDDDSKSANLMPSRMQRMVEGQFREKGPDPEREPVDVEREKDRDDDSDSDYHERRRLKNRRQSYEEEGRTRDYSSERDYRGRRDEREKFRKKQDRSYNRSPEYRSDQDEYDYRDRRDRDRRERPRDRDRRRRSPDYSYDSYYRDDVRRHPRDRVDPRDPRRGDRDRYYDNYEEDHYYRENRSRPSSRSGLDYRRQGPRDYPPRNPYFPDPAANNSQMHYYQMQQYYENMRRNDPQGYALWYERYMADKYASANTPYGNDRASVHSGRSSANIHDRPQEEENSGFKVEEVSVRSTPVFYPSAHVRGDFNNLGNLVMIQPQDPYEYGEGKGVVKVFKLSTGATVADDEDIRDFLRCPGPFIAGVTHKNTVLQYLKNRLVFCRLSSEKLLYELICLVIKLNGVVDMTDVAGLLMDSYNKSSGETDPHLQYLPPAQEAPPLNQNVVTSRFRELLLEGNKTEALDYAIENGNWGHALFLASKMGSKTHNSVMLRFANGLQANDPLQTLYQLMSGREPQAATCAADKKWGDWRPHLAMMLSNRTSDPELDRKAILSLGHTLGSRGRTFACHFCYLTAQLNFSSYTDKNSNKLVLLGSSPDLPFPLFSSCRSIMLTICYEYAKQLSNRDFVIPTLRLYKYLLAVRLIDHNQIVPALAYLERIAEDIMRVPSRHDQQLASLVLKLADKIKFADSSLLIETDSSVDPDWLARLKQYEESSESNFIPSNLSHGISTSTVSDAEFCNNAESVPRVPFVSNETVQQNYYENQQMWANSQQYAQPIQEVPQAPGLTIEQNVVQQTLGIQDNQSLDYWSNNNSAWSNNAVPPIVEEEQAPFTNFSVQPDLRSEPEPMPQISVKPGFGFYAQSEESSSSQVNPPNPAKISQKPKPSHKTNKDKVQQSSGWFGGIWDKLALRPKNQMKLPDDKNPSIVWDANKKRWVNTESNGEDEAVQLKPPPRMDELSGFGPSSPPPQLPAAPVAMSNPTIPSNPLPTGTSSNALLATGTSTNALLPTGQTNTPSFISAPNKYKLQRGKSLRANYVDVMNPGSKMSTSVPAPEMFNSMPTSLPQNLFIPAPVSGNENAPVDFISQSGPVSFDNAAPKPDDQPSTGGYDNQTMSQPVFYNPASFPS